MDKFIAIAFKGDSDYNQVIYLTRCAALSVIGMWIAEQNDSLALINAETADESKFELINNSMDLKSKWIKKLLLFIKGFFD